MTTTEFPNPTPPETTRRGVRPRLVASAVVALALTLGASLLGGHPAGAAEYNGNWCQTARWSTLSNAGSEACVALRAFSPNASITVAPGTADIRRDGLSALTFGSVQQLVRGRWGDTSRWRVQASRGSGTSATGLARSVARADGASQLRIFITACGLDAPTGRLFGCTSTYRTYRWSGQ
ncbi:MAG: hypothetical protein ACR2JF_03530 [Iamia sp.]